MSQHRNFPDDVKDEIAKEYLDGDSVSEIATKYATTRTTVYRILDEKGARSDTNYKTVGDDEIKKVFELLDKHKRPMEIAQITGIPAARVRYIKNYLRRPHDPSETAEGMEADSASEES